MMTKKSNNICDLTENQEKVKKLYLEELRNIKEREMELSERRMDLLLPLNVFNSPWLYEGKRDKSSTRVTGKWMLFYAKPLMNEAWLIVKKLYRENKLEGVISMKCSTSYEYSNESHNDGVIILYCENSSNEEEIMKIGKNILLSVGYKERQIIYYKTNIQTCERLIHILEGTIDTRNKKHTYKLFNSLYNGCLIKL